MNHSICILCGHYIEEHHAYNVFGENIYRIKCTYEVGQLDDTCDCNAGFKDVKITVSMD